MSFSFGKRIIGYFKRKKYAKIQSHQELTEIEQEILKEISVGKSYHTIADELSISRDEVQKKIRIIYEKLQHKSIENNN